MHPLVLVSFSFYLQFLPLPLLGHSGQPPGLLQNRPARPGPHADTSTFTFAGLYWTNPFLYGTGE